MDDDDGDDFHDCLENLNDAGAVNRDHQPPSSPRISREDNEKYMPQLRDVLDVKPVDRDQLLAFPDSTTETYELNGIPISDENADSKGVINPTTAKDSTENRPSSPPRGITAEEIQTVDNPALTNGTKRILLSDIITAVVFCRALYRKCSATDGGCIGISREVRSLHTVLRHLKYEFEAPESPLNRGSSLWGQKLISIVGDCSFTMRQLQHLITRNDDSDENNIGTLGRPRVGSQIDQLNQLGDIRVKLISHRTTLTSFLDLIQLHHFGEPITTAANVDVFKLDLVLDKVDVIMARGQKIEAISMIYNDDEDGKEVWNKFEKELVAEGFSSEVLRKHEDVLRAYVREIDLTSHLYGFEDVQEQEPLMLTNSVNQQVLPYMIPNEPKSIKLGPMKRKMMTETTRRRWDAILGLVRTSVRVRRIVETFLMSNSKQPCLKCSAMRLSKEKFLIDDNPKHRQSARTMMDYSIRPKLWEIIFPEAIKFGGNRFYLGTLQEIHSRTRCPFCRLVIRSLSLQPTLKQDASVEPPGSSPPSPRLSNSSPVKKRLNIPILEQSIKDWPEKNARCYASFQIDGRVLKRDADGKICGSRACTRRLRLHWDWQAFEDIHIVLTAVQIRESAGLFLGRTINSAWIGPEAFRQWTELCVQHHGSLCQSRTSDLSKWSSFFGVIDVIEMRLTSLPIDGRYIALSYVWGTGRPFMAMQSNIKNLLKYDGFRKYIYLLPKTIRDAIQLVRALGERYLWVDSLCIIQDSKRSWALNSRIMDLVYGNAYLTICAADGKNSDSGLRGMDPSLSSMPIQIIEQHSPDVQLMCTQSAEQYIRRSTWNTRAWTLQERLLSNRTLIFVAGRVYFQCRCTARSADIITEEKLAGWSIEYIDSPFLMLNQISHSPTTVYKTALQLYLSRHLTYDKDILAAFNGIGNLVCQALGGSLIHGLPSSHFDWALLWESRDAAFRRFNEDEDEMFPSWSWCGWKGATIEYKPQMLSGCEENLGYWLMNHTWITWYIRDFNGNLRRVWEGDESTTSTDTNANSWRGYHRPEGLNDNLHDAYGRYIKEEERHLPRSDFKLILPQNPYGVNIVENSTYTESIAQNSPEKDLPYLQFFTWSAFFRIQETSPMDVQTQRYNILDCKDDWCGTIMLKRRWAEMLDPEKPFEFIAISEAKQFGDSEYEGWEYYIPKERDQSAWDLYYVLLIQYTNDIAYRVGLGKIFKDAFNHSCRMGGKEWKEFILG